MTQKRSMAFDTFAVNNDTHDICGLVYRTTKTKEILGGMMELLLLTEIGERDNQVTATMKTTFLHRN